MDKDQKLADKKKRFEELKKKAQNKAIKDDDSETEKSGFPDLDFKRQIGCGG
ncbi:MAG: hypothetical protein JXR03_09580 [Cyclobacteriaceae bacterium]